MSEVSVNRTAAGGYCLIIDGTRVAGGKPEFSSDNCFYWWETDKTIGVVDDIVEEVESWKAANKKLRKSIDETCAGWAEAYETLEAENEKLTEQCNRLLDKTLELGTENAKLRERVSELEELTDHRHYIPQEWYAALQVESAKLRELVRDMWHELDAATQYDAGGVRGIVSEFADSMHDLGIEVD